MIDAALVYHTRYGTTRAIADLIADRMGGEVEVASIADADAETIREARVVVIGGPIYGGNVSGKLTRFCERHRDALLGRKIGIFISCLYRGEMADKQLLESFPAWLTAHASASAWLGGRLSTGSLRLLDRLIVANLVGQTGDQDRIEVDRIDAFVAELRGA